MKRIRWGYICVKVDNASRFKQLDSNFRENCVFVPKRKPVLEIPNVGYVYIEDLDNGKVYFSPNLKELTLYLVELKLKRLEWAKHEKQRNYLLEAILDKIRELEDIKWGLVSGQYKVLLLLHAIYSLR